MVANTRACKNKDNDSLLSVSTLFLFVQSIICRLAVNEYKDINMVSVSMYN